MLQLDSLRVVILDGNFGPKSYLLQCFEVLDHSWISECSSSLIPDSSPLVFIPVKTEMEIISGGTIIHRYV